MAYEAHVEGAPSEDALLRLIEAAKEAGADRIEIGRASCRERV